MENDVTAAPQPGPWDAPVSPAAEAKVGFGGVGKKLSALVIKGFLLQLLTLGIYRFWYVTDLRRLYWGHTTIGGEPLDYTGRAMELLKGFFVALLAPIVSIAVAWFASRWIAERIGGYTGDTLGAVQLCNLAKRFVHDAEGLEPGMRNLRRHVRLLHQSRR